MKRGKENKIAKRGQKKGGLVYEEDRGYDKEKWNVKLVSWLVKNGFELMFNIKQ